MMGTSKRATAGGALAGATVAISAPIGGTIAVFAGASSTGATAIAATGAINFAGGAIGGAISGVSAGNFSWQSTIGAGFFNAGAGMIGNALFRLRGVSTMAQVPHFAPRTAAALAGRGVNASLAWRNSILGGILSTNWAAASYSVTK